MQTTKELRTKLSSTLLTGLREGLASIRIADFLNQKLTEDGEDIPSAGGLMILDTGKQCSIAGYGKLFEEFLSSGKVTEFTGYGQKPKTFYDKNFETSPCRIFNFDQTYYKQPYDARTRKISLIAIFSNVLFNLYCLLTPEFGMTINAKIKKSITSSQMYHGNS